MSVYTTTVELQFNKAGQPSTIEEATRRYIYHFRENYRGPAYEEFRLANMTQALILDLRKRAPTFYEEKLARIVNEACNHLILNATETQDGFKKFCLEHQLFLAMLQELRVSQPCDNVNFRSELFRLREKLDLSQQQKELELQLERLEAQEISTDDIGEEEFDSVYVKICDEMDKVKDQLRQISLKIAILDGSDFEDEAHFELNIKPNSLLSRLSAEQQQNLENLLLKYVKAHQNKKTGLYLDIPTISGMLAQINVDQNLFKIDEYQHMSKEVFDAYNDYFRKIQLCIREESLNRLCKSKHLLPRHGVMIKGPDDIPEEVKIKLEQHSKRYNKEFSDIVATFGEKPCSEEHMGDMLDEFDENEEDHKAKLMEDLRMKGIDLKRVKEVPTEDCVLDEVLSEPEEELDNNDIAQAPGTEAFNAACALVPPHNPAPHPLNDPVPPSMPGYTCASTCPCANTISFTCFDTSNCTCDTINPFSSASTCSCTYASNCPYIPAPIPMYALAPTPVYALRPAPMPVCAPAPAKVPAYARAANVSAYAPRPIYKPNIRTYSRADASSRKHVQRPALTFTCSPASEPAYPPVSTSALALALALEHTTAPLFVPPPLPASADTYVPVYEPSSGENSDNSGGGNFATMANATYVPDVPKVKDKIDQLSNINPANNQDIDDDDDDDIECLGIVEPSDKNQNC